MKADAKEEFHADDPRRCGLYTGKTESGRASGLCGGRLCPGRAAGREPKDWDVCTSAAPEIMKQIFQDCHVVETGLQHGTLTVVLHHVPYEVTTFRVDEGYADHRHPDHVRFVTDVREDLARRDFTVNAMAWHPKTGLVDAFHGREDLAAGRASLCWGAVPAL